jgi:hypothetical protein
MHEYEHLGSPARLSTKSTEVVERERKERSLATFLLTTLLLPSLLVAPTERDIRIVNVVNRFYSAAAGLPTLETFLSSPPPSSSSPPTKRTRRQQQSIFLSEGKRALRTTVWIRHLQRILDALPAAQIPKTDTGNNLNVADSKAQKSNIVAVTVSPGIGRVDTVAAYLNANWTQSSTHRSSWLGIILCVHSFSSDSNRSKTHNEFPTDTSSYYPFSVYSPKPQLRQCKLSYTSSSSPHPSKSHLG